VKTHLDWWMRPKGGGARVYPRGLSVRNRDGVAALSALRRPAARSAYFFHEMSWPCVAPRLWRRRVCKPSPPSCTTPGARPRPLCVRSDHLRPLLRASPAAETAPHHLIAPPVYHRPPSRAPSMAGIMAVVDYSLTIHHP
jgi:hypothetical protein